MFTIPSGLIDLYNSGIDSIIEFNGIWGKLVYPPKNVKCINCQVSTITGKSLNKYLSGGPVYFVDGTICPYCGGDGQIETQTTENIKLLVYWTPKEWVDIGINIDIPANMIQTKSYLTDLPKIERAAEIRLHSGITAYKEYRYQRTGEPVPHGFKSNRYILTMWTRI